MANKYIGVEQEFVSFEGKISPKIVSATNHFNPIKEREGTFYEIGDRAIRTMTGHAFYTDGSELETCTPPVRINPGFASRLTDLIMIGRDKIAKALPDLTHTGLSMHWNISEECYGPMFYAGLAVPFHLFGITPLSTGLNMRIKSEDASGTRMEFLGDYLTNESQINALALLMGAYSYAFKANDDQPAIRPANMHFSVQNRKEIFLPDGRFSDLRTYVPSLLFEGTISAQHYLELFFKWIKPYAQALSTQREFAGLENFIFGRNMLEFDQFKFFAHMTECDAKKNGTYYPLQIDDSKVPNKVLVADTRERRIPLEGRLFGEAVRQQKVKTMTWGQIIKKDGLSVCGIDNILLYGNSLNQTIPLPENSPNLDDLEPGKILTMGEQEGPVLYDERLDKFRPPEVNIPVEAFKKAHSLLTSWKPLAWGASAATALALLISGVNYGIHANQIKSTVQSSFKSSSKVNPNRDVILQHSGSNLVSEVKNGE